MLADNIVALLLAAEAAHLMQAQQHHSTLTGRHIVNDGPQRLRTAHDLIDVHAPIHKSNHILYTSMSKNHRIKSRLRLSDDEPSVW